MHLKKLKLWSYDDGGIDREELRDYYEADSYVGKHGKPSHELIVDRLFASKDEFMNVPLYVESFSTYEGQNYLYTYQIVGIINRYLVVKGNPFYEQDNSVYFINNASKNPKITWLSPEYEEAYGKSGHYHGLLETDYGLDVLREVFLYKQHMPNRTAKRFLVQEGEE